MVIPDEVKSLFKKQSLVSFATVDEKGNPNVVPIFWKSILDEERILLIDNFMRMSKNNILKNNSVCVAFWDSETEEAYKIKGEATYHIEGMIYERGKEFIQSKKPEQVPKGVVEIKVKEVYIIKPGPDAGKRL